MKLRGTFILRQVADEIVAVPVGESALELSGMVLLNEVSRVIWTCLERDADLSAIQTTVTKTFDVSPEEANQDILEFLDQLRKFQLLSE